MMHMTFYWGKSVTILFDSWRTNTWLSYSLSLIACFLFSVFYQYMEDRRIRFKVMSTNKKPFSPPPSSVEAPFLNRIGVNRLSYASRYVTAVLFGVNSAIGYFLMLAIMSFNWGVFIAVVVGLSVGYFVFRCGDDEMVVLENPCACA